MTAVFMATRLPCLVCGSTHRTHSQRMSRGKWVVLCVSCNAALVKLKEWHRANPKLDAMALMRVYVDCVPKPASEVAAAAREKIA